MKLASFRINNKDSFGIYTDKGFVDLSGKLGSNIQDLKGLLKAGLNIAELNKIVSETSEYLALDQVEFLPVIPNPEAILCMGMNTHSHVEEVSRLSGSSKRPVKPMLFQRLARTQVGHNQPLERPNGSPLFDYEGEIAIIIGKEGRHVAAADALDYVAGYACYNEASIRDYQLHSPMYTAGKNFPNTGGFGPWLVTTDEIGAPESLELTTRLNGKVVQTMTYDDLIFPFPEIIAYVSEFTTLIPGDVIVTGSAAGVGIFRQPPTWMQDGDICEVEIKGIGTLSNPIKNAEGSAKAPVTRDDAEEVFKEAVAFARGH